MSRRRPLLLETLEDRILCSATAPVDPQLWQNAVATEASVAIVGDTSPARGAEIVFVDTSVSDHDALLVGMSPDVEVVRLDANRDGIQQIADHLAGRRELQAIHLISHGSEGSLQLGSATLTAASMQGQYATLLGSIGQALSEEGDLLIYGCDFGKGAAGENAARTLAAMTGGDVASSTNATGSAARGGDWILENHAGAIEAGVVVSAGSQSQWGGLLAAAPLQFFYLPYPEDAARTVMATLQATAGNDVHSITSISVSESNTIIYYDHWEGSGADFGYEANLANPTQASTQIWGDGNAANGATPGAAPGTDPALYAGQVITLENDVPANPRVAASFYFDGGDKIGASKAISVARVNWSTNLGAVSAEGSEVYDTRYFGTSFTAPVGENTVSTLEVFELSSFFVMASQDNTVINIDHNADGDFLDPGDVSGLVLSEGGSYATPAGTVLNAGARITASKPVQVHLVTGDVGPNFESRNFTLLSDARLGNDYYSPVGTTSATVFSLFIHNPNAAAITVNIANSAGTTPHVIAANTTFRSDVPFPGSIPTATRIFTPGGENFSVIGAMDVPAAAGSGQVKDWGFSLKPTTFMSSVAVAAYAPGYLPGSPATTLNASPLWVTVGPDKQGDATTRVFVDWNGDLVADTFQDLAPYQIGIFRDTGDPLNDQTGARIYTTDGTLITTVWGQDPSVTPDNSVAFIDAGYAVPPIPVPEFFKFATFAPGGDVNGDGYFNSGDRITYTLQVNNIGVQPITNAVITDALPSQVTYVNGTTFINQGSGPVAVADDSVPAANTRFPLDVTANPLDDGLLIVNVAVGATTTITFDVTINSGLPTGVTSIFNAADFAYEIYSLSAVNDSAIRGTVTGRAFDDRNNDGIPDAGESGIAGVAITLTGTDIRGIAVSKNTTTDASGNYRFVDLRESNGAGYTVTQTQPAGYLDGLEARGGVLIPGSRGGPNIVTGIIVIPGENDTNNNFADLSPSSLAGTVFHDLNNNGVQLGAGETGVSGVTITLSGTDDLGNAVSTTMTTDASGAYAFSNLRPGTYTLTETAPAGLLDGRETVGSQSSGTVNNTANSETISAITLSAGVTGTGNNFGELPPSSFAGTVYRDVNNDGVQSGAGETGINAVTVTLTGTDDRGAAVSVSTSTNAAGAYSFGTLRPGTYSITETQPAGFLDGRNTAGTAGGTTVNNPPSDVISAITLVANTAATGYNFGEIQSASLSGSAYIDANNDGVFQGSETAQSGVTITLTGTDDLGAVSLSTTTNAAGAYSFSNLRPGTYTLTETQPAGLLDGRETAGGGVTAGGTVNNAVESNTISGIVIASGQTGTANNFADISASSLAATVYRDLNNDGIQSGAGETGISGVGVTLTGTDDRGNPVSATVATNASGNVSFTNLRPGTYTITETQPAAFLDGLDSNGTPAGILTNDQIAGIAVAPGTTGTGYKFGELSTASVSGTVYRDLDNDGVVAGAGETGIGGVTVTLTGTDDLGAAVNLSTTTAADGSYSFAGIRPSNGAGYTITQTQPAGFLDGRNTVGSAGGATVNNPLSDVISGVVATTGAIASGYNFGELPPSTLSGSAYIDANNDGIFQGGETAQSGVTITLTGTDDLGAAVSLSTTTNGTGAYAFAALRPGTYVITQTQPAGLLDGRETAGSQGSGTVSNSTLSNTISAITLASDTTGIGNNFADLRPGALSGSVFDDRNNDGLINGADSGIAGVTVTLTGTDDRGTAVSISTATNGAGAYSFGTLRPGTYVIAETQAAGFLDGKDTIGTQGGATGSDVLSGIALAEGVNGTANNFGELAPSAFSGTVYRDLNNDGVQSGAGETGISGVAITLTGIDDLSGAVSLSTTTDGSGNYTFTLLRPGTYTITETQPAAFNDGLDSNGTPAGTLANDQVSGIALPPGTNGTGYTFGELPGTSISGTVYRDADNDGMQAGAGETGIAGVTVTLTGNNDLGAAVSLSTTTDGSGDYTFGNLRPSNATGYTITETQPAGLLDGRNTVGTAGGATVNNPLSDVISAVVVAAGNSETGYNFGELTASTVSGTVFNDLNNNGALDGAESGITGVTVTLTGTDDLGNAVSLTTATSGAGAFSFGTLRPGTYTITETQPAAFLDGNETAGTLGGSIAVNDRIGAFTVASGTSSTGNLFAEVAPSSLAGRVFDDTNNNGVIDGTETGISGVTVTLNGTDDRGAAVSLSTTTNGSGAYSFGTLRPGTYTITETQPAGFLDGKDTIGTPGGTAGNDVFSNVVLAPNTNGVNNNFAELRGAAISGGAYIDANNDGVFQVGETAQSGVTITLTGTDDLGAVLLTTTTAGDGSYSFGALRPGTYSVSQTQPAGLLDGKDTAGSLGGSTAVNDTIGLIIIGTGESTTGNTFGDLRPASLAGSIFSDTNNNGAIDGAETGIATATVALTGTDDLGNSVTLTTTTSGSGAYLFATLRPGTYTITETQPAGFLDGTDAVGTQGGTTGNDVLSNIVIAEGTNGTANNFGELVPSVLSGRVFNDADNDGLQNAADTGIAGATVTLSGTDDRANAVALSTTTNGSGDYSFGALRPGSYVITETQPAGLLDGRNTVGSQGGATSNNPLSDSITEISLATAGVNGTGNNFAELNPASFAGFVYQDLNNNGVREAGESGVQGAAVALTGTDDLGNAVSLSTSTGNSGSYSFTNVRPGTYTITETQPTGYVSGTNSIGTGLTAPNTPGTVSGDNLQGIVLATVAAGNNAGIEYNFGEILTPQLSKSVVATSQASTLGNAVAPGETVRYRIVAEVTQSTFADLVVTDLLPAGMSYVSDGTATYAFVATNGGAFASTVSPNAPAVSTSGGAFIVGDETTVGTVTPAALLAATNISSDLLNTTQTYLSGGSVHFHLGNISNFDGDTNREFVVIEFNALVRNETGMQAGTTLGNGVRFTFDTDNDGSTTGSDTPGATLLPASGPQVTVAEPNLSISKTTPALPNPVDAGDTIAYTITITNNSAAVFGAANAADAFDVRVQDILDAISAGNPTVELTLATPATDVSAAAPGYAVVTNNSTTSTVDLAISRLNVGDSVTITVNALVKADAPAGATITNTATASYTSLPGVDPNERTGADVPSPADNTPPANSAIPNNYAVGASAANKTVGTPTITKTLVSTSEAATTGTDVAVGETVTYALNITLPEGVTQNVSVIDALPTGLEFLSATADFTGSGVTAFVLGAPGITGSAATGTNVSWTLNDVANPPDGNVANDTFRILVTVRVADLAGNTAGITRTNDASLTYTDGTGGPTTVPTNPAANPTVTVVEPRLTLTKGVDDATPDIGQTLTYTLTIANPAVANAADAFDIFVRDILPAGLALDTGSILINGVGVATSPLVQGGTANSTASLLDVQLTTLATGGTITITYEATVNNALATGGMTQDNSARIYWDSLAANDGDNSVQSGTPNPGSERDFGATPGYTETPTPGVDDPAQDTHRIVVNTSAITGTVYEDTDGSGTFTPGETGLANVSLRLTGTSASGLPLDVTVTTAPDGSYSFGNLPPGTYLITETQPAGYVDGLETAGTLGGVTSPALGSNTIATITIPAQSNATETGYNFGETPASSLAGSAFLDADNDGLRAVGETGLANIPVTLTGTDAYGQVVSLSTTTDASGNYVFTGLRPSNGAGYTLTEDDSALVPGTYLDGTDTAGTSGGGRGGAAPKYDALTGIVLAQGTNATGYTFAEIAPASLAGSVFDDVNRDGARDGGEPGVTNVTITLTGIDDLGGAVNLSTLTDGAGAYSFTGLRPGSYTLTETHPAGYGDSTETVGTLGGTVGNDVISAIPVTPGASGTSYTFAETTAAIEGTVFIDSDRDGFLDATEPGRIAGVTVQLFNSASVLIGTTLTAADGSYSFGSLLTGDYTVVETQPNGYGSSTPDSVALTLPATGLNGIDFAETTGSIAGAVFHDRNNDGLIDAGEPALGGVTVTLTGQDVNGFTITPVVALTAPDGSYTFTGLLAGSYTITETQPAGYGQGIHTAGTAGGDTSVQDVISGIGLLAADDATAYAFGERTPSDLVTTKTDSISLAQPGQVLTYEITVSNVSLQQADSVIVSDQFPQGVLEFISASNGGVYDPGTGVITWNLGALPTTGGADQPFTLTVVARVVARIPANTSAFTNTVTATDPGNVAPDPTPEDNTASDSDSLPVPADLYVLKTQNVANAVVGQQITYTITGGNAGGRTATGVTISDTLPVGVSFVSASEGGYFTGGQVLWEIPALEPGQTFVRTVTVTVTSIQRSGTATNTVVITDDTNSAEDATPFNNTSSVTALISPAFTFAFDSFRNFAKDGDPLGEKYHLTSPHLEPDALLPLAPIYSGEADPGSTLVVSLYNSKGENIGSQTVVVDSGGNWLASFPSTTLRDTPQSVQITQQTASYSLGDNFGHNLRTYFSPALNPGHFFESVLDSGIDMRPAPLLDGLGLENPLQLGAVKYGGEVLGTQSTASGY